MTELSFLDGVSLSEYMNIMGLKYIFQTFELKSSSLHFLTVKTVNMNFNQIDFFITVYISYVPLSSFIKKKAFSLHFLQLLAFKLSCSRD